MGKIVGVAGRVAPARNNGGGDVAMEWSVSVGKGAAAAADLLVVAVPEGRPGPDLRGLEELDRACDGGLGALADGRVFAGRKETTALLPGRGCAAPWLLLAGLGRPGELTLERLRRCAGVAAAQARRLKARRCALLLPDAALDGLAAEAVGRAWVEGTELALGAVEKLRGVAAGGSGGRRGLEGDEEANGTSSPETWRIVEPGRRRTAALARGLAEGQAYAAGCLFARRLVNLPPNVLTPARLADEARALARAEGYACRALGPAALARLGMGGLLGVARGSRQEPRLILLESPPAPAGGRRRRPPLVARVGQGRTFDSGGRARHAAARREL
ncbi:MAG: M17 family peptidase N-terminal domain-containing protein, partial [Candidatus Krumholzibacteriia bacterium]